jgi:hypothetical protein
MKKVIVLALCLTIIGGATVFGLEKTAGIGIAYRGIEDITGVGVVGFFGPGRFVELSAGVSQYTIWDIDIFTIQLGLYLKYPIPVSDRVVLFPTAGVEFEYDIEYGDTIFWILGGAGLDFFLTDTMFLRTHVVVGQGTVDEYSGFGSSVKLALGFMLP